MGLNIFIAESHNLHNSNDSHNFEVAIGVCPVVMNNLKLSTCAKLDPLPPSECGSVCSSSYGGWTAVEPKPHMQRLKGSVIVKSTTRIIAVMQSVIGRLARDQCCCWVKIRVVSTAICTCTTLSKRRVRRGSSNVCKQAQDRYSSCLPSQHSIQSLCSAYCTCGWHNANDQAYIYRKRKSMSLTGFGSSAFSPLG